MFNQGISLYNTMQSSHIYSNPSNTLQTTYTTYTTPPIYATPFVPQKGVYKDGNTVWLNGKLLWRLM